MSSPAKIVVIGAGWWSQGWHIPQLHRNARAQLVAVVDSGLPVEASSSATVGHVKHGQATLMSLGEIAEQYQTQVFTSVDDLLAADLEFDGVIIATPHATHFEVAQRFVASHHVLLEKPMTTDIQEAHQLWELVQQQQQHSLGDHSKHVFVNHTANYRRQTLVARESVQEAVGRIRHVSITMASALTWLFDDVNQTGWTQPSGNMLGNGFGWGQLSHPLAWIAYVCPQLRPKQVLACHMIPSAKTGADMVVAATVLWLYHDPNYPSSHEDDSVVTMSISGTCLLPGNEHSDPPVGKLFDFQIYGDEGAVLYSGDTRSTSSGSLQVRRVATEGTIEYPCPEAGFEFENCEPEGDGPESVQNFLDACQLGSGYRVAADVTVGLRSVQVLDAMYRSHKSGQPETVLYAY